MVPGTLARLRLLLSARRALASYASPPQRLLRAGRASPPQSGEASHGRRACGVAAFSTSRAGAAALGKGGKKPAKPVFLCSECGEDFPQSHGKCPACNTWGSLKPFTPPDASASAGGGGGAGARVAARVASTGAFSPAGPAASAAPAAPPRRAGWVTSSVSAQPLSDVLAASAATAAAGGEWRQGLGAGALAAELQRVLGGGVVPGSLILLGGDPGVGKSTLLLQLLSLLASPGGSDESRPVLYSSAEESVAQVAQRADRLGLSSEGMHVLNATRVEEVLQEMARLRPCALVVDSIQTVYLDEATGSAGSVSQVRECATAFLQAAKASGTPIFLVGHVTKGGDIAGPRTLEHLVDVVLYLEGEALRELRVLRGVKNRYGASDEVGVFEMAPAGLRPVPNPSAAFLSSRVDTPGLASAVAVTLQGARAFLLEVQALCVAAPPRDAPGGGPSENSPADAAAAAAAAAAGGGGGGRRSAVGVKPQRLNLLLAVLAKRTGLGRALFGAEVFVNVVGGRELEDPAADLALACALAAAHDDRSLPHDMAFVGELGLGGELRKVPLLERRLAEASRLGFNTVLVPAAGFDAAAAAHAAGKACRVVPCATLREALGEALPQEGGGKPKAARGRAGGAASASA